MSAIVTFGLRIAFAAMLLTGTAYAQRLTSPSDSNYVAIQHILKTPEQDLDLVRAKLSIDGMIDASIDKGAISTQLDTMAKGLQDMLPAGASPRVKLEALRHHIYKPTAWNDGRPFEYDLNDPYGENLRNKLLGTYLRTRKGNCVSMPLLFVLLGQKLGLEITVSNAPNHVFVQWRDTDGQLYNLETTSGAGFARDIWMRQQFDMTDQSLKSGIYMQPLSKRETVALMAGTLLEFYGREGRHAERRALAALLLRHSPRNVAAILQKREAVLEIWNQEFARKYHTPRDIPQDKQETFFELYTQIQDLEARALKLGWRPPREAGEIQYRETIRNIKQKN
ncbi:MAG: hypothetical protein EON54_09930 [Alcaligenaceae bacterium]|nr:MAG: hypothetical protein EON54_09930 [Alcaligenaceae bacterium]